MTNAERVAAFMRAFGQEVKPYPEFPFDSTCELRVDLIQEELDEFRDAIDDEDLVGVADAITDLLYVVYGAGHAFGIPVDECFKEVHASNMTKLGPDGSPIYRADGKVVKGPGFREPDLESIINK